MIGRPPLIAVLVQGARDDIFILKDPIIWYSDVISEQAMSLETALIEVNPDRRPGCGPDNIAELCSQPFLKIQIGQRLPVGTFRFLECRHI